MCSRRATSATATAFVERFGDAVDDDIVARLDEIQERVPAISASLAAAPWTLLHGDFRLDNLLFRPDDEIVVLDLQGLSAGRPAVDVAYFITTALDAEHRDEEEAAPAHLPRCPGRRRRVDLLMGAAQRGLSTSPSRCWRTAWSVPRTCSTHRSATTVTTCST